MEKEWIGLVSPLGLGFWGGGQPRKLTRRDIVCAWDEQ